MCIRDSWYKPGARTIALWNDGNGSADMWLDGQFSPLPSTGAPEMNAEVFPSGGVLGNFTGRDSAFRGVVAELIVYRVGLSYTTPIDLYLQQKYLP